MASDIITEQTGADNGNLLDESGNMLGVINTVRGVEMTHDDLAIREEKDECDFDDNQKVLEVSKETPNKSVEPIINTHANDESVNHALNAADLPASATEVDPDPSKGISAF